MDLVAKLGALVLVGKAKGKGDSAEAPLELPWLRAIQARTQTEVTRQPSLSAKSLISSLNDQLTVRRLVITSDVSLGLGEREEVELLMCCLSGQGEILNLEAPCTLRDAALAQIKDHEKLRVVKAQVNGRLAPLSRPLQNGDVVSFFTRPYGAATGASRGPPPQAKPSDEVCSYLEPTLQEDGPDHIAPLSVPPGYQLSGVSLGANRQPGWPLEEAPGVAMGRARQRANRVH
jgi:molybdopterin converting factor small subunit